MSTVPDLAILGARVRTLDPSRPAATALAVKDGVIVAVGDDASVRAACDGTTTLVDGSGLAIVPGLNDCHIHHFWSVESTRGADLSGAHSLEEVRRLLAAERDRVGPGGWILGWGLWYQNFKDTGIRGDLLDLEGATGGQPTFLTFFDGHTSVANKTALDRAGVTGPVVFTETAAVVCDADGVPTGELQEWGAKDLVRAKVPDLTEDELYAEIVAMLRRYNRLGLTTLHGMDGSPADFDLLRTLEANGDLTCRVVQPLWQKPHFTRDEMRAQLGHVGERGRRWKGGVAKFFLDGVIDTGTGWLLEPDTLGGGTAPFWPDPAYYAEAVALFARAGFQCATHCVGDGAVRFALDAYKAAGAAPGVRHRIEHIEQLDDADLPRFAAENVVASMQPLHMQYFEADRSDAWCQRVGEARWHRTFRCGDLRAAGAHVALGSDWMVATCDPRVDMAWAVLRRPANSPEWPPMRPEQALTPIQTLEGYTTHAAWTISEEARAGQIRPGYNADLTAFAEDPTEVDPDQLPSLPVLLTMVDGEIVHRAEA